MNKQPALPRLLYFWLAATALLACAPGSLRASMFYLHPDVSQDNDPNGFQYYYAYPYFDTDYPTVTSNRVSSPNGDITYTAGPDNHFIGASGGGTTDMAALVNEMTNGLWTLVLNMGDPSEQTFYFRLSITGLDSGTWPLVTIDYPPMNATGVSNRPAYHWSGPSDWDDIQVNERSSDYSYYFSDLLDSTNTDWSWPAAPSLPSGDMQFEVRYELAGAPMFQFTTPTNSSGTPLAGWSESVKLLTYRVHDFTVAPTADLGHVLIAHYPFDNDLSGDVDGADTSGNGNDINGSESWAAGDPHQYSSDAAAGTGAALFHGVTALAPPDAVVTALAGSFSISAWLKTTQSVGAPGDGAYYGAAVVSEWVGDNSSIPISLTGGKVAFGIATAGGGFNTLHSTADVNTGDYIHVVVTRSQASGEKKIYINGMLDSSDTDTTAPLDGPKVQYDLLLGGNPSQGYDGLLDDVQIYTGVLSDTEVAALYATPGSTAPNVIISGNGGHTNLAYYSFEDNSGYGAEDFSGNGNTAFKSWYTGMDSSYTTNDALDGSYAMGFPGTGWLGLDSSLTNLFAHSFTVSLWLKTSETFGNDDDSQFSAAGIVSALSGDVNSAVMPMGQTGSKLAFYTGGSSDDMLRSVTDINSGDYIHVAVTRNQATGEKKIYVNGVLDNSSFGSTDTLDGMDQNGMEIGYNNGNVFTGEMDEVQFYSGVLSATEIASLYNNPGTTIADQSGSAGSLGDAVNAPELAWTTGGDASWFAQSDQTHDGTSAAQSGAIGDDQQSWIETTVSGPGTLSFWWNVSSDDFDSYDYLEFDVDGGYEYDIAGEWGWDSYDLHLGPGSHTLRWTYFKDSGFSAGADAGYLDEVSFVPDSVISAPTLTIEPLDQTNHPGYKVALLADSTNAPALAWQWYKVGTGLIAGATNKFYSPTNSGSIAAAGSYFVIATDTGGAVTSRTAVVTFETAPAPPDWSIAFPAQLSSYDGQHAVTNLGIACLLDSSALSIYSANSYAGTNSFAGDTLVAGPGKYGSGLLKHLASGTAVWARGITNTGNGNSFPQCLAPGPHNDLYDYDEGFYMSGVFSGTNGIGNTALVETAGDSLYLVRFDLGGNVVWVRTFGGTNVQFQSYHQLVADPAGNVTMSALGNNLVNFGTTNIVVNGQKGVLVQYDLNGNLRWVQQPSGWVQYMVYDSGRIYVTFEGNTVNYIGGVTNISDRHWAIAALNATNGQALWVRGIGSLTNVSNPSGLNFDTPTIAVSGTNLFFIGTGWGSNAVFGAYTVSWPNANGQYFARYDTNGNAQLAVAFGGARVAAWASKADASGNVYVGGDFDGYATFGDHLIGAPHYDDLYNGLYYGQAYLAKFDRDGTNLWVRQALSPVSFVNLRDLALAPDGIWADGFLNQQASFGAFNVYGPITCVGSPFCFLDYHEGGFLAKITESTAAPMPVTLANPQIPGADFQFQFTSQSGFNHAVQYRTNLTAGLNWQTYTNVSGDGALKTIAIPLSVFSPSGQGFIRVSTE